MSQLEFYTVGLLGGSQKILARSSDAGQCILSAKGPMYVVLGDKQFLLGPGYKVAVLVLDEENGMVFIDTRSAQHVAFYEEYHTFPPYQRGEYSQPGRSFPILHDETFAGNGVVAGNLVVLDPQLRVVAESQVQYGPLLHVYRKRETDGFVVYYFSSAPIPRAPRQSQLE